MNDIDLRNEIQRHIEGFAISSGLPYDHPDTLTKFDPHAESWHFDNAMAAARLSALAYHDEDIVRTRLATFSGVPADKTLWLENTKADTQAFAFATDRCIHVVFRGSESIRDWLRNVKAWKVPINIPGSVHSLDGNAHKGFVDGFNSVWDDLKRFLERQEVTANRRIWFSGHSLGGALATLALSHAACIFGADAIGGLYTFGQPRVVDRTFQKQLVQILGTNKIHRVYRCADPVPIVPRGYKHVSGKRCYISRQGVFLPDTGAVRKWWERTLTWSVVALRVALNFRSPLVESVSHHYLDGYLSAIRNAKRDLKRPNNCVNRSGESGGN